ncbi:asparagine synthase (glutamine-hydrolyzing) [Dolichospermum circinale]|uniref:asparagine synthase (glutamine-hydrolyzing) n=1 Tax=Dolichospermum circinale TaxID=109265 RepID=UPI00232E60EB|nr:asparagine synthase (glutamine-hydrolyzing) [Dolichospermum circinale]MDB9467015.1 asparagine synthase (glutamine-hydrolyzing) [Dolichospermum circinale CS-539/09]MDB9472334.1 asparagine synthase (glutamine-hydrolyzing) [Dolichospermum circinale CS-539]
MCGIAGLIKLNTDDGSLEAKIEKMQTSLKHRGPDDAGIYISTDKQAALAHTRLSILDLSAAGHQPMSTTDNRYHITFNGEIYNFQELRENLISQGEKFHSQTDTEVILKLYQKIGFDCVQHLRGMFAFAIWDDLEKTCFLARDPLGIKPLYYYQLGTTLVFASELRAVLASGLPAINMSVEGLYGYLTTGSVPEPYTLIADIHCLSAGNWLYWHNGNTTKKQYWQINFTPEAISPPEAQEIVRKALLDSIQHHFISDVPVGIFLSGGIDSTTILALATQTQQSQLSTYSIAFAESEFNEGELAEKIANHFGAKHTEYQVTSSFAKSILPDFLAAIDQPSIDGFNTFCVSKVAHDNGMKVVLSGLGGDEIFGGYKSFQKVPQMVAWSKNLNRLPFLRTGLGLGLERWENSLKIKRLGDFLKQPPSFASAYNTFRGIFSHQEACLIINQLSISIPILPPLVPPYQGGKPESESSSVPLVAFQEGKPESTPILPPLVPPYQGGKPESESSSVPLLRGGLGWGSTPEDEVSFLELSGYMRNQLLRDSDIMSMNWGLELRVPFVDKTLLGTVAPIPSNIRLAQGKKLLTQAITEIPDWVINRPKKGFSFPFESWMNSEFGDYFHNVHQNLNIPPNIPLKPWYRRWSLAILNHWWEQINS